MSRRAAPVLLALGLALASTGCGGGDRPAAAGTPVGEQTVHVFAAASLTEAFGTIAREFEAAHPGTTVTLNLGASSALAQQVLSGAPADVFAAASPATMQTVVDAGQADGPQVFVRNTLTIAVPKGNPGRVRGLADFADEDRTLALCAEQVPCGAAAVQVLAAAGVEAAPDTLEQDVRAALSKVRLGEVDAALVYRTDVLAAAGEVEGIEFPEAREAVNDYLLAPLGSAPNPSGAEAFAEHVLSEKGQQVLAQAGFEPA